MDVIGAEKPDLLCIASPPPKSLVVFCSHLSVTLTGVSQQVVIISLL